MSNSDEEPPRTPPLRHRNHPVDTPMSPGTTLEERAEQARVSQLISMAISSRRVPPWVGTTVEAAKPLLIATGQAATAAAPYVQEAAKRVWEVYKVTPTNVLIALYGLGLCFFGGHFAAAIVAVEAFRLSGWDMTRACIYDLWETAIKVKQASERDDLRDDDHDGIADVKQISPQELALRKLQLMLMTVDPERVSTALGGIYQGLLGVLMAVRYHFAKTVALGVSIGNALRKVASSYLVPILATTLPPEYHKWISPVVNYTCKVVGVLIAWSIQQAISTVQSAILGGLMAARAALHFAADRKLVNIRPDDTYLDEIIGWSLAVLGIWFQFALGFSLPFPFNIILLPLTIVEWTLRFMATWME